MTNLPNQVVRWNETNRDYKLKAPLNELIENQVDITPDAIAVSFEGRMLSYSELNSRANKLARYLQSKGAKIDSLIGVFMDRSLEMVVALLAIIKAGAAYVPFDPEYPKDRLQYMFEDSAVDMVLTQGKYVDITIPLSVEKICLDSDEWWEACNEDDTNLATPIELSNAAYMIYTSGSTGRPKGVINEHGGLLNRLIWMQEAFQIGLEDRILQKTPYSFDVSVWEFFWPLITGATIVMAIPGGHKDNEYLVRVIVESGVTVMHFVPSMLNLFLSSPSLGEIKSLRKVMCSGEALPFEVMRRFFERIPNAELHNLYGPTEAAIDVTHWPCTLNTDMNVVPIGKPIANIQTYILNKNLQPVAIGDEGELFLSGIGVARGYWNKAELTAEKFLPNPFSEKQSSRMYRTGDLARYLPDGNIEYLGRIDNQIKLRGFRIELGEIEATLLRVPKIIDAAVVASDGSLEDRELIAYLVSDAKQPPSASDIRKILLKDLPDYMVPARFNFLSHMPLTPNGKLDRKALSNETMSRPVLGEMYIAPRTETENRLCSIWTDLLRLDKVGIRDNFFELGGNSIRAVRLVQKLHKQLDVDIPIVKIFEFGTIEKLADYINGNQTSDNKLKSLHQRLVDNKDKKSHSGGFAVIGMAGRFPGAQSIEELWDNLCNGIESISTFGPDELDPFVDEETRNDPNYVPARGILENADKFDNTFFGIGPLEAKVMDPQQRVFLELAWAALENAGYSSDKYDGMIGVYAGVGDNHYYSRNVLGHRELVKTVGDLIVGYGNEKDYIATRVSFALDLTGPSVSANTGCSTSLLAVDQACKALEAYECDMALAGGVDIHAPQKTGQMYTEGGTFTRDGHCKPFDADATGTMFSDGAGIVVVKRLDDALRDGDTIYALVKGIAKNNDGANKVSFLAPSVEGQAKVITMAHAQANISADTVGYVEAHGTGTPLGDPIEIEGLTKAFGLTTDQKQYCLLGSLKGNVGHPTIASGVAGLIKAVLSLYYEKIPPTLHFKKPNPRIDFDSTPFKVVSEQTPWPRGEKPRRAGVSSFGFGGTNVHAVLEEAPIPSKPDPALPRQVLLFSAKTEQSLQRTLCNFEQFFKDNTNLDMGDVAYTLQLGRKDHEFRHFLVSAGRQDAIEKLKFAQTLPLQKLNSIRPNLVFMFPGQGSQYINMGRDLYHVSRLFKALIDQCCEILRPHMDRDLREILFPSKGDEEAATASLRDTYYTQPALFVIEYALANLWMSYGLQPRALVGHSVGEYVAACLAGVMALEDAVPLVSLRAKLVGSMPAGSMLSVRCSAEELLNKLPDNIQLAASNSPNLSVVAGPTEAIDEFINQLQASEINVNKLHTSHAFHSAMMDPVVEEFTQAVAKVKLSPPKIPIMSTCTGNWLADDEAIDPTYWGKHLRNPVLFSNAVSSLMEEQGVFLEVGPRDVLSTLARQHAKGAQRKAVISSLANSGKDEVDDEISDVLSAIGALWLNGIDVDWKTFYSMEKRRRVPLPTYSFEPNSFWLQPVDISITRKVVVESKESQFKMEAKAMAAKKSNIGMDPVLRSIVQILKETVGCELEQGDEYTPFIMLGADSLVLMQISRMVKERLAFEISLRQLLDVFPSPVELARAVREKNGDIFLVEDGGVPSSLEGEIAFDFVAFSTEELGRAFIAKDDQNQLAWFIRSMDAQGGLKKIVTV